jgi:hypothetical protein
MNPESRRKARKQELIRFIPAFCVPQRYVRLSRGNQLVVHKRKSKMNPESLRKAGKQELIRIIPAFLHSSEICPS